MIFEFPMPPNLLNRKSGTSHWRTMHREKQAYFAHCDVLQASGRLPRPPRRPWGKCQVTATLYLGAQMDDENAMARASKWQLDWLESRGYLQNDRDAKWAALPQQIVKRGQEYKVVLTLEPSPIAHGGA